MFRAIRSPVTIRQFLWMNETICAVFSTKNTQAVRKIPRLFENSHPRSSKWRKTQADNGMKPVPNSVIVSHQINISTFSMLLFYCEDDRTNVSHSICLSLKYKYTLFAVYRQERCKLIAKCILQFFNSSDRLFSGSGFSSGVGWPNCKNPLSELLLPLVTFARK